MTDQLIIETSEQARQRVKFRLDSVEHEVLYGDELSLDEQLQIARVGARMQRLGDEDALSSMNDQAIRQVAVEVRQALRKIVPSLSDEEDSRLSDAQRMQIIGLFQQAPISAAE